jgi:hypothetical protein
MGTYYFNIHCDGFQLTDIVGELCPTAADARAEACRAARALIQDELLNGRVPSGWIEVEDEEHRPVMVVPLRDAAS